MASTQEILDQARNLGKMIKDHDSVKKLEKAVAALKEDKDAQQALNDYNQQANTVAEKEQKGQPVEVEDKHKLQELHKAVILNKVLQDFQVAQMDYADLMRQVDLAMTGGISPTDAGEGPSAAGQSGGGNGGSPIIQ